MRLKVTFRQRPPYTEKPAAVGQLAKIIYKDISASSVSVSFSCAQHTLSRSLRTLEIQWPSYYKCQPTYSFTQIPYNSSRITNVMIVTTAMKLISYLVGVLSPVSHGELYQG